MKMRRGVQNQRNGEFLIEFLFLNKMLNLFFKNS